MEENAAEINGSRDDEPSTSSASDPSLLRENEQEKNDEEMSRLMQAADEMLENKAKSMNLSSLNVRSILHHLIKYPSAIDVLLGIRENYDLPSVRNMRSRRKPDESGTLSTDNTPKKIALRIEDKGPKNFLDLEYEEDDEYDEDYVDEGENSPRDELDAGESEDEEDNCDEEEEEEDDVVEEVQNVKAQEKEVGQIDNNSVQNDTLHNLLFEEGEGQEDYALHITLNDTRPGSTAPVPTLDNVVDDDDYRNFVISLRGPPEDIDFQAVYDTEDDAEDEDYNVIADNLNVEDWDETRQDKTTLIPRHEVKALMMDTLLAEKEIPINVFPEEAIHGEDYFRKNKKDKDTEAEDPRNQPIATFSESCTLLNGTSIAFRPQELEELQMQLEQHVQLLTQFVVTCHHDDNLAHVRNSAQLMINELDDIRRQQVHPTLFDVPNLDAAIESCHDINSFEPVDKSLLDYAHNTDGHGGVAVRPEAATVLSRSLAIRFPALVPLCQPGFVDRPIPFLNEEDLMLAIGLLQFSHLPRRADKENNIDRYTAIHQNCLPARSPYKIRNHLKSMRRHSKNPIHEIIQAAEQGICKIVMPQKTWHRTYSPIYSWPIVSQPGWYRQFLKTFNVTEDRQIHRKDEATMVLTPTKTNGMSTGAATAAAPGISDNLEFVDIGRGHDGRTIVMDREHIQELVNRLLKENENSPSKRRKNPTPMKLSTMIQLEKEHQNDNQIEYCNDGPSTSEVLTSSGRSKASRKIEFSGKSTKSSSNVSENTQSFMNDRPSKSAVSRNLKSSLSSQNHHQFNETINATTSESSRKLNDFEDYSPPSASTPSDEPTNSEAVSHFEFNSNSCSSFPIPATPGCRSVDEHDDYFMDLETNSLMWTRTPYTITEGNPLTPRGFSSETVDPIDFSSLGPSTSSDPENAILQSSFSCQKPMGYSSDIIEFSHSPSIPEPSASIYSDHRTVSESIMEDETSMPGLDLVPPDDEEDVEECFGDETGEEEEVPVKQGLVNSRPPLRFKKEVKAGNTNLKASRKRTRIERETMGSVGLEDETLHEKQKDTVMRKVIEDISQRLFMHKDTYQRFKKAITDKKMTDIEKVSRISLILANYPELLNLVLLYAPPEAVVSDSEYDTNYQSYKSAMEMIMDIERYITAAKLKEPSLRGLFRFIQNFLVDEPNMTDEQATHRFYQLFGQDRPLWKKLEPQFWCLPFKKRPRLENYEYIDLTGMEAMTKKEIRDWNSIPARFETVDDIDQVMGCTYRPPKNEPASNLVVKCGELCIQQNEDTFIQLEISERHWTRKDDITLLTEYNKALNTKPNFTESQIPSLVPDLPFGEKSIIARLQYLIAELKSID